MHVKLYVRVLSWLEVYVFCAHNVPSTMEEQLQYNTDWFEFNQINSKLLLSVSMYSEYQLLANPL